MKFIACFCYFILFEYIAISQVVTTTRPQPWPLQSPSMIPCCKIMNDVKKLSECASQSYSMQREASNVALVSYLSAGSGEFGIPDILRFGSYMIASTAVYAEHNNYSFHWMNADTGI